MTCYERGSMFVLWLGEKITDKGLPSQYGKMTSRGHLHLTLRFLGDMGPEEEQKVSEICRKIDFKPVPFSVDRYGFFPSFRKPASFHLRLKFFPELKELKVKVDALTASLETPTGESIIYKRFDDAAASQMLGYETEDFSGEAGASAMVICCFDKQSSNDSSFACLLQFNGSLTGAPTTTVKTTKESVVLRFPVVLDTVNSAVFLCSSSSQLTLTNFIVLCNA